MKRREFLTWVGLGTLATSLPVALAACNPAGPSSDQSNQAADSASAPPETTDQEAATSSSVAQADDFTAVGTVSTLDQQGFISAEDFPGGAVMVIRNPEATESLIAVSSICPHRGCIVEWQTADEQFLCPCHDSTFEPDGRLVAGPASRSLETYAAKIAGDQVLVQTAT